MISKGVAFLRNKKFGTTGIENSTKIHIGGTR